MDVTSKALCGMGFGLGCSLNGGYYKSTFSLKFRGCSYIMQSQTWGEGWVFLIYYNITWWWGWGRNSNLEVIVQRIFIVHVLGYNMFYCEHTFCCELSIIL